LILLGELFVVITVFSAAVFPFKYVRPEITLFHPERILKYALFSLL
jgi:hypothetical protein